MRIAMLLLALVPLVVLGQAPDAKDREIAALRAEIAKLTEAARKYAEDAQHQRIILKGQAARSECERDHYKEQIDLFRAGKGTTKETEVLAAAFGRWWEIGDAAAERYAAAVEVDVIKKRLSATVAWKFALAWPIVKTLRGVREVDSGDAWGRRLAALGRFVTEVDGPDELTLENLERVSSDATRAAGSGSR